MKPKLFFSIIFIFMFASPLFAQGIHIRTIPIIAANQSEFYLSLARGMGNLSIAFDDPLGDPFINPAKASRIREATIFSSPTRNSWSNENGRPMFTSSGLSKYLGTSINSIPFGGFFQMGKMYAGGMVAYQGYSSKRSTPVSWWEFSSPSIRKDIGSNSYVFGLFGVRFPESNVSIAASISSADYKALDGVNLLYPGSSDIKQSGWSREYKLGILAELTDADQLEFVAAQNVFKARHEVTYPVLPWIVFDSMPVAQTRSELNRDESKGWILHGGYKRRIDGGWKIGAIITVNWKEHPKIPTYKLSGIPRDPGTSIAYNIGIGAVRYGQRSTWGLEYVYEPITSYTWAEAEESNSIPGSQPLPSNFKTVENFFDFSNHILRLGLQTKTKGEWLENRFGVQLHFYNYDLNQNENIIRTSRFFNYHWLEATLSGGLNIKFSNIELMYTLQVILGNGIVGTGGLWIFDTNTFAESARANDFLIAPSGSLVVDKIPLLTHQITFVYRLK